jgi:hypothetical protein
VNEKLRDKISREIYERRKSEVGTDTANLATDESEDEDLIGYDAIEPGLPPASSDRQKWWLENGKMARSSISPPKPDNPASQTILNPKRPANPHAPTDEPDWVNVPRSESRLSSFSSMSTSPYEHVNHSMLLSSSASSTAPRKLPPPYDPSALPAKVGRLHISEDQRGLQSEGAPPPPPPRRQTSMGPGRAADAVPPPTSVQPKRKPVDKMSPVPPLGPKPVGPQPQPEKHKAPPPVAKKPAHLTSPTSPANSSSASLVSEATVVQSLEAPPPSLPRRTTSNGYGLSSKLGSSRSSLATDTGSVKDEPMPPLQPPRRTNTSTGGISQSRMMAAGGVPLVGLGSQEQKPQPPSRKPVAAAASMAKKQAPPPPGPRRTPAVDLLADDGATELGGWEALRPS